MIRTFKVQHNLNLDPSLFEKATQIANFALEHGPVSSKEVKHIGLKSGIACQILRKYGRNKKIKTINPKNVKLTVPGQGVKFDKATKEIYIAGLKARFHCWFPTNFIKVNQVELDKTWAWVTVTFSDELMKKSDHFVGIDLNSTSHSIVVADSLTGKVQKLGRQIPHLKKKYRNIRRNLALSKQWKQLKKVKNREHRKTTDIIHKITRSIVDDAAKRGVGIKLEDLKGIRKRTQKYCKEKNFVLNSWPFFMIRAFLTYKAKAMGVEIVTIDPRGTSMTCSRCGHVDKESRQKKVFHCTKCGHLDHADANAAFNIAVAVPKIDRLKKRTQSRGQRDIESNQCPVKSPEGNVKEDLTTLKIQVN